MKIDIETKYNIDDKVKILETQAFYQKELCPFCKGNYKIETNYCDEEEGYHITCKTCNKGYIEKETGEIEIETEDEWTIGSIHIHQYKDELSIYYGIKKSINNGLGGHSRTISQEKITRKLKK